MKAEVRHWLPLASDIDRRASNKEEVNSEVASR